MSITQQEKNQTRAALKREIKRQSTLIEMYEAKKAEAVELGEREREVVRCDHMIERCKKTITAAASELGVHPAEQKRGPGRPPKTAA